jgi:hypothetical protein
MTFGIGLVHALSRSRRDAGAVGYGWLRLSVFREEHHCRMDAACREPLDNFTCVQRTMNEEEVRHDSPEVELIEFCRFPNSPGPHAEQSMAVLPRSRLPGPGPLHRQWTRVGDPTTCLRRSPKPLVV